MYFMIKKKITPKGRFRFDVTIEIMLIIELFREFSEQVQFLTKTM